jgi:hypothetical protein
MSRSLLIAFLAAAFLVVPAMLPSAFVDVMAPGLSGSAHAATNLNSSRSNIYRTKKLQLGPGKSSTERMGGGGGVRGGNGARMGGGGGLGQTK